MDKISLEARANNIEVSTGNGKKTLKVVNIEGHVRSAEIKADYSYKRCLHIYLDPETQKEGITQLNFDGTSPIRGGDKIRAGLILNETVKKNGGAAEAFYVEIINQNGHYLRRDFRDRDKGGFSNRDLGLKD